MKKNLGNETRGQTNAEMQYITAGSIIGPPQSQITNAMKARHDLKQGLKQVNTTIKPQEGMLLQTAPSGKQILLMVSQEEKSQLTAYWGGVWYQGHR